MYFFLHNFTLSIMHIVSVHFVEMLYKFGKDPSRIDRAPTFYLNIVRSQINTNRRPKIP
jgi:hypothetical protein